jgi:hypothetical protein
VPEGPSDNEQIAPIRKHDRVTISAAERRTMWNSSWKNAVLTSWSDISDVSAAIDRSVKNVSDMI